MVVLSRSVFAPCAGPISTVAWLMFPRFAYCEQGLAFRPGSQKGRIHLMCRTTRHAPQGSMRPHNRCQPGARRRPLPMTRDDQRFGCSPMPPVIVSLSQEALP
jgi:hypothetical protein